MTLDESNIDSELENYLEKHFPKEVRLKRIEVETERGIEQVCLQSTYSKNILRLLRHSPKAETNSRFFTVWRDLCTPF